MTLSDFRTGHPPIENVGGATSTRAGYPPMTQTTFLTCRAHYPGGPNRCVSVFFPVRAAFPNYLVGRHPRLHFRGLLELHSRYGLQDCSPAYGGLLSRGFSPASYPTKPLGSYHVLPTSTWVNPPFTGDLRRWGAQVMYGWPTNRPQWPATLKLIRCVLSLVLSAAERDRRDRLSPCRRSLVGRFF
jgi:hypothetical protein